MPGQQWQRPTHERRRRHDHDGAQHELERHERRLASGQAWIHREIKGVHGPERQRTHEGVETGGGFDQSKDAESVGGPSVCNASPKGGPDREAAEEGREHRTGRERRAAEDQA